MNTKNALEIVRRRIDESGTKEPLIQSQGLDRILVQLPGVDDPDRIKRLLGKTAKLTFHLVDDENIDALNANIEPFGKMIVTDIYDDKISIWLKSFTNIPADGLAFLISAIIEIFLLFIIVSLKL